MRTGRPKRALDVEYVCQYCGVHYSQPAWRKDNKVFCSRECWRLGVPGRPKGSRSSWKQPCLRCGAEILVYPSNAGRKYCSKECQWAKDGAKSAKKCPGCGVVKSFDEYHNLAANKSGKSSRCKVCVNAYNKAKEQSHPERWRGYHRTYARQWNLKRTFGLSIEEYDALYDKQGGVCAICLKPEGRVFRRGAIEHPLPLAVDHDHKTGRIRGLLCKGCNQALGQLGDTAESLRRAIAYLEG